MKSENKWDDERKWKTCVCVHSSFSVSLLCLISCSRSCYISALQGFFFIRSPCVSMRMRCAPSVIILRINIGKHCMIRDTDLTTGHQSYCKWSAAQTNVAQNGTRRNWEKSITKNGPANEAIASDHFYVFRLCRRSFEFSFHFSHFPSTPQNSSFFFRSPILIRLLCRRMFASSSSFYSFITININDDGVQFNFHFNCIRSRSRLHEHVFKPTCAALNPV